MGNYRKKRNYKKKRKPFRPNNSNMLGYASGIPRTRRAKLRWSTSSTLDSEYGVIQINAFNANGINYPKAGTHAPMGFSTWSALYNHYIVVGAKVNIQAMLGQTSDINAGVLGCYISDDTSLPYSDFTGFIEAKRGSWRTLTNLRKPINFSVNFSTKKFFNLTDVKDNNSRLGALVSANPAELAYFNVWYQSFDTADANSKIDYIVTIEYIVEFSEPKDQVQG